MTIRCVACGRFIPYSDIYEREAGGLAKLHFEPLSEYGKEIEEWTCPSCVKKDRLGDVAAEDGALAVTTND